MYLGLDQSPRRIGYALGTPDAVPITGVWSLPPAKDGELAPFLCAARKQLELLLREKPVELVCFESPLQMIGSETNRKKFALAGVIELACYDLKIKCLEVSVNTWRKPFMGVTTGGTKFLKDEAMRECVRRGWFVESDDEADACGILSYAMSVAVPGYGIKHLPLLSGRPA